MRSAVFIAAFFLSLTCAICGVAHSATAGTSAVSMDPAATARFAGLALKCLHDEYPNHISLTLDRDADARPPR